MILFLRSYFFREKNGNWNDEVSFLLTFLTMNACEGQTGHLSLETVNPKNLENPSELQIEDCNFKKNTRSEDSAPGKEQDCN